MSTQARRLEPRRTPKQARSIETRQRFLDAAARVFARHGYSAGTTNRMAEEAGASIGSLYQYFPNKDAMLVALVRRHIEEGTAHIVDCLDATAELPLLDRLGAFVDAMLDNHLGDPRLHQVLFEEAPRPPELLAELHALDAAVTAAVQEMVEADARVQVADPAMAARLVVTGIESHVHRFVATDPGPSDVRSFRHELVTMLTRYLEGPPAPVPG